MQCRKCKQEFEPSDHKKRKADWICTPCEREAQRQWRLNRKLAGNPVKSGRPSPEWERKYREAYDKDPKVRARKAENQKRYRNSPELRMRHEARWQANNALQSGKIIKQPCIKCGNHEAQMHHPDYFRPLDIEWLCAPCHRNEHARAKGEA